MVSKSTLNEDQNLPQDKLCEEWLLAVEDDRRRHAMTQTGVGRDDRQYRFKHAYATGRGAWAYMRSSLEMPGSFSFGNQPRTFFDSLYLTLPAQPPADARPKEEAVNQEKEPDNFHDSDVEDIYDLYLACNGVQRRDGLLDIRQLDELTPDEAEILNVPRLREIWKHTETGCIQCKKIIKTLDLVRNVLREEVEDILEETNTALDQVDSISH